MENAIHIHVRRFHLDAVLVHVLLVHVLIVHVFRDQFVAFLLNVGGVVGVRRVDSLAAVDVLGDFHLHRGARGLGRFRVRFDFLRFLRRPLVLVGLGRADVVRLGGGFEDFRVVGGAGRRDLGGYDGGRSSGAARAHDRRVWR